MNKHFPKIAVLSLLLISFFFSPAFASVPKLITYQGILKDSTGNYLTGTYAMTFRIYGADTGGTALWTETQSSISTTSGKFSVQLGSVTALNLSFNADYWLSVQVGSDTEMTPRVRLTSTGYAYMADQVANGFTQAQHDTLSHKNIQGVRENSANIAKTNFKLDSYTAAAANSMGDMIVDTFNDATGIAASLSSGYSWRGSPNYDVVVNPGGIDSYVKLMLHANGTNGSTTFTDSSNSPKTVSASGNASISTAQSKFGGASGYFNGGYLSIANNADWNFGTGDFTYDFWVMQHASVSSIWIGYGNVGNFANTWSIRWDTTQILVAINAVNKIAYPITLSLDTWYHIAVTRSGTTLRLFVNGVQQASATSTENISSASDTIQIGQALDTGGPLNGWIDEVRISKGIARWTSNFTPPSTEYTGAGGSATVVSNAYSEPSNPAEVMIIADETLNTGSITYYVSRDNGTTWTQCPKETVANIGSQPSGTQMRWKAVINGDAVLSAIAIAV